MTCKGVECIRHKAKKPVGTGRYEAGQVRCQTCAIFMNYNGLICPCCNTRLRTKPRNLKFKTQLMERGGRKEYGIEMDNEFFVPEDKLGVDLAE